MGYGWVIVELGLECTNILEALESGMCDVIKIRLKGGMQREVGKETSC